jgi:hypothetical protein
MLRKNLRKTFNLYSLHISYLFKVVLTPSSRPPNEPLTHAMSFTLRGLQSGSVYEAIVQAKNRYGWNEVSLHILCKSNALFNASLFLSLFLEFS